MIEKQSYGFETLDLLWIAIVSFTYPDLVHEANLTDRPFQISDA